MEELGRGAREVGPGCGVPGSGARPSLGSGGAWEVLSPLPARGEDRGPFPPERGAAALTCAFSGSPHPAASRREGRARWARCGAEPGLGSRAAPALRSGAEREGQRCSPAGLGGRRTCSTLDAEVIFPAPGSGLASHPPQIPEPLSFCFLPSPLGAFFCSRGRMNLGRCPFGSPSRILSWWLLLAGRRLMNTEPWNRSCRRWKQESLLFCRPRYLGTSSSRPRYKRHLNFPLRTAFVASHKF
nr:elongation of very long chain fatty acids protein 7 isoform X3 [Pan troglodytes]